MPSPFPGMDPYLETPELWPDVHHELTSDIRNLLNPFFRAGYLERACSASIQCPQAMQKGGVQFVQIHPDSSGFVQIHPDSSRFVHFGAGVRGRMDEFTLLYRGLAQTHRRTGVIA